MNAQNSEGLIDLIDLVRSLQRREGKPDCFRTKNRLCDETDCVYRQWCLIDTQPPNSKEVICEKDSDH